MKSQQKLKVIFYLLLVTLLGLLSKSYSGFGHQWVNDYAGDILYEIFWCLFIFGLRPTKTNFKQIPILVFGLTCILEVLQLWKAPFLETARSSLVGKLLLGTTFSWEDFMYYGLGCLIGWFWLGQIGRSLNEETGKS